MKKCVFMLICFLSLVFASCAGYSADEILSYRGGDFEMDLSVVFEGRKYDVVMKKEGKFYDFIVDSRYTFVYDGESWLIKSGNYEFPVSNEAFGKSLPKKMIDVIMSNSLSVWKITLVEENGDRTFICDSTSSDVLITVDAETKIPIEFSDDGFLAAVRSYKLLGV